MRISFVRLLWSLTRKLKPTLGGVSARHVTSERLSHPSKAYSPSLVTLAGIVKDSTFEQFLKALSPIKSKLDSSSKMN